MRAIIYTRVSTKEQVDEGNSLATQERQCRAYAAQHDYEVARLFEERGESAKTADRTQLKELMNYCAKNRKTLDVLIIYRINRLSRKTYDYGMLKAYFLKLGIKIISVSEPTDNTPAGKFVETMFAAAGELDNDIRAEQSKTGMIDGVKGGRWMWQAPFGYINVKVDGKKNIAPVEGDLPKLIREAWLLLDAGFSQVEIRKKLFSKGLAVNGKMLSAQMLSKMYDKTLYKGVIEAFNLLVVSESIVPIIEPELWDRVAAKLRGENKKPPTYTKVRPEFPLRGTLLCQTGHKMTASSPRGNGGVYPMYHCAKCRGKGTNYSRDVTETKFVKYASGLEYTPALHDALSTAIDLVLEQRQKDSSGAIRKLKSQLEKLENKELEIGDKNLEGIYADEFALKMLNRNNVEVAEVRNQLGNIQKHAVKHDDSFAFGLSALSNVGSVWLQIQDVYVKDRFQKWLFPAGLVYDGQKFGTKTLPLCLSIKNDFSEEKSSMVNPKAKQVETFFDEMEYIDQQLKVLGLNDREAENV
jgi:site-specific DNA recombinase